MRVLRCLTFVLPVVGLTPWSVPASKFKRALWMSSPTLSIDLSQSWSTSDVVINQLDKPSAISGNNTLRAPGLFWSQYWRSIIVFGGNTYGASKTSSQLAIWQFKVGAVATGDGNWTETRGPDNELWKAVLWPYSAAYASGSPAGLAYGGITVNDQDSNNTPAPLGYTTVNSTQNEYHQFYYETKTPGLVDGKGHYMGGFGGEDGVAVVVGGRSFTSNGPGSLRNMSQVIVMDMTNRRVFNQTATGDVPKGRVHHCMTGAQGSDSYEIFVLGGSDPNFFNNEATDLQNVYILSLPAFRWFKTPVVVPARAGANCHVVRNQMLTYGGWDPTTSSSYASADSWTYGLGIFDTSSLTWGTAFNGSAEVYGTPEVVKRWYAGNSKYPTWNDPDTAALFTTLRAAATSSSPTSTPTPSSTSGLSAPLPSLPADSKTNVGAIAGGVVGGVAVLAAVAFLLWFFCMRGKKEKGEKGEGIPELHNQRDVPEMVGEGRPFLEMDAGGERRGAYEVDGREKGGVDVKDVKRVELEPVELA
ncbi:Kelch motif [Glarea lozoyensis ATCC 20868]|uniref:Kelch motif n=1 Tax=Glarea lozoyensis (strain ATCC 20868 / MF5171) TaxID=1116229 RepID=S3DNY3_GLAL2|nr:Kelch motif [Glarea lozoyensis ATCC 20868]EPE28183.1 Kelch motif [Glarea lozoyensis ATCC 20868]